MMSSNQRFVIVFNGEIYNFDDIRSELNSLGSQGRWKGSSDTEVLLEACVLLGIDQAIRRTSGMFAVAVWDNQEKRLTLARDRMGEKPLYFGLANGTLLFGSELKALQAHPYFENTIDRNAIASYLRHNYVPAPLSIYQGIQKLRPGFAITISLQDVANGHLPNAIPFWTLDHAIQQGIANPFEGSDQQAVDELEARLAKSIKRQMVADVPLGAMLSGGIPSGSAGRST